MSLIDKEVVDFKVQAYQNNEFKKLWREQNTACL